MTTVRRKLEISEVSLVKSPANPSARVALFKAHEPQDRNNRSGDMIDKSKLSKEEVAYLDELEAQAEDSGAKLEEANAKLETATTELAAATEAKDEAEKALEAAKAENGEPKKIDKSALPKEVLDQVEALEKSADEAAKRVAKLEDEALTKSINDFIATVPTVAAGQDDLAETLKGLGEDARKVMMNALTTAEEKAKSLFGEIGKGGDAEPANSAYEALEKKGEEIRKSDPSLSNAQAFEKATIANPDLYAEYQQERRSRAH